LLFVYFGLLLSDTKLRKNIRQQIICGDLSGDFSKVMERSADIHGEKIVCDMPVQAFQNIQ